MASTNLIKVDPKVQKAIEKLTSREYELKNFLAKGRDEMLLDKYKNAFDTFTHGIDHARKLGFDEDFHLNDANPKTIESLPALYVERAQAAVKLENWDQAIFDCNRALHMLICPRVNRPGRGCIPAYKQTYGLALVTRGHALKAIGLHASARYSFGTGANAASDEGAADMANALASAHNYPIKWGGALGEKPVPRSSVSNYVNVEKIDQAKVPNHCIGMSANAHKNKIYLFGGKTPSGQYNNALLCFHPNSGIITRMNVVGDPNAPDREHREPPARSHHCTVIVKDKLYIWGGQLDWKDRKVSDEERTIWFVDLTAPVMQWDRLVLPPKSPGPGMRKGCAYAAYKDGFVVFGGAHSTTGEDGGELWKLELTNKRWVRLCIEHRPRGGKRPLGPDRRTDCVGWIYDDFFFVFGGVGHDPEKSSFCYHFNDVWRFDLRISNSEKEWKQVLYSGGVPPGRSDMGFTVSPEGVAYMLGGATPAQPGALDTSNWIYSNDALEFASNTSHWRQLRNSEMQGALGAPRAGVACAWLENLVYVFGGGTKDKVYQEAVKLKMKMCALCTQRQRDTGKLYQCSGCKELDRGPTYYCSLECQQEDWVSHSFVCADGRIRN